MASLGNQYDFAVIPLDECGRKWLILLDSPTALGPEGRRFESFRPDQEVL